MDRDHVIATLRAHEAELKAAGFMRLRVFGSVARGDHGAESDLDIVVDFDETNGVKDGSRSRAAAVARPRA